MPLGAVDEQGSERGTRKLHVKFNFPWGGEGGKLPFSPRCER